MTPETTSLIDTLLKAVIAIAAVYGAYRSKKNSTAIEVVRNDVNDKMQQFIKTATTAARAEGVLEQKTRQEDDTINQ